jgi:hypothetical protein
MSKKPTAFAKPSFAMGKKTDAVISESLDQDELIDAEFNQIQNQKATYESPMKRATPQTGERKVLVPPSS